MSREHATNPAEHFLSQVQSATIDALGARETGRTRNGHITPDQLNITVGWMRVNGYMAEERGRIIHAYQQYRRVVSGELSIKVARTPDIEPFFLP